MADAADRLRRLLAILPWLAEEGTVPIPEAARRAGMGEDDLVGLLEQAACCGLPPYTPDQLIDLVIFDGAIQARPGRHLSKPMRLSPAEGFALATAARTMLSLPGVDPKGPLARALGKLESALGAHAAVVVQLSEPPYRAELASALDQGGQVEIDYYSGASDEITTRLVDPHAMYAWEGHWYLEGYCHLAKGIRHFRLDRLRRLEVTGARAEVPRGTRERTIPRPSGDSAEVVLELSPHAAWVAETYPVTSVATHPDGSQRVTLPVSGIAWLERLVLRLGPHGKVVAPPEFTGVALAAAERILAHYRDLVPGDAPPPDAPTGVS